MASTKKSDSKENSDLRDLLQAMEAPSTFPCVAQFHNETPPEWNVHIIGIGAVFKYEDNSAVQVGPIAVDIAGPNGMVPLNSPNPAKCVVRVTGAISVKAPGQDPQPFSKENAASPGNCLLLTHFILAPKSAVSSATFDRPKLSDILEFKAK